MKEEAEANQKKERGGDRGGKRRKEQGRGRKGDRKRNI